MNAAAEKNNMDWIQETLAGNMEWIRDYTDRIVTHFGNGLKAYDMEDLYQEASIAFWKACESFDPEKGASINTYASRRIFWVVKETLRSRWVREAYYNEYGFSGEIPEAAGGTLTEEETFSSVEDKVFVETFDRILAQVYHREKSKCIRYGILAIRSEAMGMDRRVVAEQLGVTTNYLSVCTSRARKLLEPYREEIMYLLDA
ncbi:MAG: hypothetical protein LUE14_04300 [Clostridiales bacterium]|nr:hypothetical protein [Clostridiales bacterium]